MSSTRKFLFPFMEWQNKSFFASNMLKARFEEHSFCQRISLSMAPLQFGTKGITSASCFSSFIRLCAILHLHLTRGSQAACLQAVLVKLLVISLPMKLSRSATNYANNRR
jgi:hypothetical protein